MPRKQLSEFRAKTLLYAALDQAYQGWEVDTEANDWWSVIDGLDKDERYVVKIDQAEKGRFKKGLVKLNRDKMALQEDVRALLSLGYRYIIIEVYQKHEQTNERYLSLERKREGTRLSFSANGGIDIESQPDSIVSDIYSGDHMRGVSLPAQALSVLAQAFEDYYFSFVEINPLLVRDGQLHLLDAAVEVDSEAQFLQSGWTEADIRRPKTRTLTTEEKTAAQLASQSQASFSLEVINPDGGIFLLLSGGGASVVVADEVHNLGYGDQLGNYGEYSGNPNLEETKLYTEQILSLMLKSKAPKKVLIIGGGVANFTDIRTTFTGVIAGMKTHEAALKKSNAKVFVRRGGPHEREGLAAIRAYLDGLGIAGTVASPELLLSDIVKQATDAL